MTTANDKEKAPHRKVYAELARAEAEHRGMDL